MKKVMFDDETKEYFGDYGDGMVPITRDECFRFVNSLGVKCYGSENGYTVYAK